VPALVASETADVGGAGNGTRRALRSITALLGHSTEGRIGLALLIAFLFVIAFGPLLAPYDPLQIGAGIPVASPSGGHLLGTDGLGRDVLSRLLAGGRSVVVIPLASTSLAFIVGGLIGMLAGYLGGWFDAVASRITDVLLSLPTLLLVLVVMTTAGASTAVLVVAVAAVYAPRVARVLRGATRVVAVRDYVQAAQARGERPLAIVVREIVPNVMPTLFVEFASRLSWAVIFVATLNFLGLGVQPPSPNWAVMVSESRGTITEAPLATLAPALAIGALSVAIGLIADAVTRGVGLAERLEFLR
jgi:peptide/nickel transport system permease protein